jgi:outer membrane protein assembly factor BamB
MGNQAPAIVIDDAVLAAGGADGGFAALDDQNGRVVWSYPTTAQTISPLIEVAGTVIGADVAGNVYAFRVPTCHRLAGLSAHACVR